MVRKKQGLSPATMPLLRDDISIALEQMLESGESRFILRSLGLDSPGLAQGLAVLERAELWWVRPDMAKLAMAASATLPEDTVYEDYMPGLAGVLIWEKGVDFPSATGPSRRIMGAVWIPHASGLVVAPLEPSSETKLGVARPSLPLEQDQTTGLDRLLATTWLLATQETVGSVDHQDSSLRRATVRVPGLKLVPSPVHIVTLREAKHHEESDEATEGEGSCLSVRFLVRGHWRNQVCGPGRRLRRPTWVAPYIKGPEGAPIKEVKPTVKIWRR